jgi:hypothetical protein
MKLLKNVGSKRGLRFDLINVLNCASTALDHSTKA